VSADREATLFSGFQAKPTQDTLVALLRFHQDRVYNVCFHVLTHPEDAEDASQEVLIEAVRFLPRMKDARAFKSWLYQAALSTSLNIRRSRARRAELARRAVVPATTGVPSMDRAERDAFMQAISDLDDEARSLLLEHYFDKATLEELGRREGVSAVAIWKRLERAKERLKQALAGAGFAVAAAGVGHTFEAITPMTAPALLVSEAVVGKATLIAMGGAAVGTKAALSGGMIAAAFVLAGVAGTGGYFIGARHSQNVAGPKAPLIQGETGTQASAVSASLKSGPVSKKDPAASADGRSRLKHEILHALASMNGKWLRAATVAAQLVVADPDVVWEALQESWPSLSMDDRIVLLRAFEEEGHARVLDILDLAMRDKGAIRGQANGFLLSYAFQNFDHDDAAYRAWRASVEGKPLDQVRTASALQLVGRLEAMSPDESHSWAKSRGWLLGRSKGVQAMLDAGILNLYEKWLAGSSEEHVRDYLRLLDPLPLDEVFLRRNVLPWITRKTTDGNVPAGAFLLLGRPGNTWAIDVLMPYMQSGEGKYNSFAAQALAAIGDVRVIPAMIEAISRDNTYDTVYGIGWFGLGKLTGVPYDEKHDGAWWTDWWQKNQARFMTSK
jgi:RNA polymerase sigma-70 factor (ECF subfamily)